MKQILFRFSLFRSLKCLVVTSVIACFCLGCLRNSKRTSSQRASGIRVVSNTLIEYSKVTGKTTVNSLGEMFYVFPKEKLSSVFWPPWSYTALGMPPKNWPTKPADLDDSGAYFVVNEKILINDKMVFLMENKNIRALESRHIFALTPEFEVIWGKRGQGANN
jgi:hypothetical protein